MENPRVFFPSPSYLLESLVQLLGLIGATVTELTAPCRTQLVDIVEVTVLYGNFETRSARISSGRKADFYKCFDFSFVWQWLITVSHIQPSWGVRVASISSWIVGWHFCSCISLKTIPVSRKFFVTFIMRSSCDV